MTRTDTLKQYLTRLAADVAAEGKFTAAGSDRAQAAARSLVSGAGGMLEVLLDDVKHVAGERRVFVPCYDGYDQHSFTSLRAAKLALEQVLVGVA